MTNPLNPVMLHIYRMGTTSQLPFSVSVEVHGVEHSFGCTTNGVGIYQYEPKICPLLERDSERLGITSLPPQRVNEIIEGLKSDWPPEVYDPLHRNCWHFCDAFCQDLGVGPIPERLKRDRNPASAAASERHACQQPVALVHAELPSRAVQEDLSGIYADEWTKSKYKIIHSGESIVLTNAWGDAQYWSEKAVLNNREFEVWGMTGSFQNSRIFWSNKSCWRLVQPEQKRQSRGTVTFDKNPIVCPYKVGSRIETANANIHGSAEPVASTSGPERDTYLKSPVKEWTEDDVSSFFDNLSRDKHWTLPSEAPSWASIESQARRFKVSGKILEKLDDEGWEELGIRNPVVRSNLLTELWKYGAFTISNDKILEVLDADGFEELGITNPVARLSLQSAPTYCKKVGHKTELDGTIKLHIKIKIFNIWGLDTISQKFSCHFVLTLTTEGRESRLTKTGERIEVGNWDPAIRFPNLVKTDDWKFQAFEDGAEIKYTYRVQGTFLEPYELQCFPFDVQHLTIKMTSMHSFEDSEPIRFVFSEESKFVDNFGARNEYSLTENVKFHMEVPRQKANLTQTVSQKAHQDEVLKKCPIEKDSNQDRPLVHMHIKAERYCGSYIWNTAFPLSLLNMMCMTVFAVPHGDAGDRLQIALTLLLTAVTFKSQIERMLPHVRYTTIIEKYVLASFFFMFLVSFENFFMGVLALDYPKDEEACAEEEKDDKEDDSSDLEKLDKWFSIVFLILLGLIHLIAWLVGFTLHRHGKHRRNPRLKPLEIIDKPCSRIVQLLGVGGTPQSKSSDTLTPDDPPATNLAAS